MNACPSSLVVWRFWDFMPFSKMEFAECALSLLANLLALLLWIFVVRLEFDPTPWLEVNSALWCWNLKTTYGGESWVEVPTFDVGTWKHCTFCTFYWLATCNCRNCKQNCTHMYTILLGPIWLKLRFQLCYLVVLAVSFSWCLKCSSWSLQALKGAQQCHRDTSCHEGRRERVSLRKFLGTGSNQDSLSPLSNSSNFHIFSLLTIQS